MQATGTRADNYLNPRGKLEARRVFVAVLWGTSSIAGKRGLRKGFPEEGTPELKLKKCKLASDWGRRGILEKGVATAKA